MSNLSRKLMMGAAGAAGEKVYVEDVFSTYLYTGNGSTQTITNGIDLSGEGGLVWMKERSGPGFDNHILVDTARGRLKGLFTDTTYAEDSTSEPYPYISSFNSDGFTAGYNNSNNYAGSTYASWTFRKAPKFFDVVTWTGSNDSGTNIGKGIVSHNLGSAPGCVIVKNALNTTDAQTNTGSVSYFSKYTDGVGWAQTNPDANNIYVGYNYQTNDNGATMVAYLFAHDAGGFGLTGTDNVISCGSFTTNSSGVAVVDLGYEPQWVLVRPISGASNTDWRVMDNMRGITVDNAAVLRPNSSAAEFTSGTFKYSINGFTSDGLVNSTECIYIAIRRGPMRVPESGTSVYNAIAYTGNDAPQQITGLGFPPDLALVKARSQVRNYVWEDRLRGADKWLASSSSDSEGSFSDFGAGGPLLQNGITVGSNGLTNEAPTTYIFQGMRRAPGFFDVVCWTGDGTNPRSISHNLTVAPTLIITKKRNSTSNWITGYDFAATTYKYFNLNDTGAATSDTYVSTPVYGGNPTASVFIVGNQGNINQSADTYRLPLRHTRWCFQSRQLHRHRHHAEHRLRLHSRCEVRSHQAH
jgi:hypothetical protein